MQGRVFEATGSWYKIHTENNEIFNCRIKGNLRLDDINSTNPLVVGDYVNFEIETNNASQGIIHEILPRDNYICRRSPRNGRKIHILAANIDEVLLLVTLKQPRTSKGFIDRFLLSAEMFHIPAVILVNKKDLYTKEDLVHFEELKTIYTPLGYRILLVSSFDAGDINKIKRLITGKTSMFVGHSGVGKSSMLNSLSPELNRPVNEISTYSGKGMHTTVHSLMFQVKLDGVVFDSFIIDTPGVKEWEPILLEPAEVGHYFPEIRTRMEHCRFNNCLHVAEPKCAVTNAVESEEIAESRYISYLNILEGRQLINPWDDF